MTDTHIQTVLAARGGGIFAPSSDSPSLLCWVLLAIVGLTACDTPTDPREEALARCKREVLAKLVNANNPHFDDNMRPREIGGAGSGVYETRGAVAWGSEQNVAGVMTNVAMGASFKCFSAGDEFELEVTPTGPVGVMRSP